MQSILNWTFALSLGVLSSSALAIGMGDVTGDKKDEGGSSGASLEDVTAQQDKLVKKYVSSAAHINEAQLKIARALELKGEVAKLEESAKALESGSVTDEDSIEKISKTSAEADNAISKKMKAKQDLSADSKKELAKSLVPYAIGLREAKAMSDQFEPFLSSAKDAIKNASMTKKASAKNKLGAGMYVAKNAPGLTKDLLGTSQNLLSYAKSQNVDVPKEATDKLGSL